MTKANKKWMDKMMVQRILILVFLDTIAIVIAYFLGLFLRFDLKLSNIPIEYLEDYWRSMPYWVMVTCIVFFAFRLYHSIWRFAGMNEMSRMIEAYLVLLPLYIICAFMTHTQMPRSYYCIGYVLSFMFTAGIRFSYRAIRYIRSSLQQKNCKGLEDRVMIIGAGRAGQMLIREMLTSSRIEYKICCIIDDNPIKIGRVLGGIPIVGDRFSIPENALKFKISRIIYAIPGGSSLSKSEILSICSGTGCKLQKVPTLTQIMRGDVGINTLKQVEIEDLLGREPIKVNNEEILNKLSDKVVLVTGGGGSIGSELCRQIAGAKPRQLIILDIYENNAYDIQNELWKNYPSLNLVTLIGSVRDERRVGCIMKEYHPDIVFHAAAHKHVPLMEGSPNEAIKNNVLGTLNIANAADENHVSKMLLISTDKAVNPTNIMGASKRICEMIVQMMNRRSQTQFMVVRFGNVLDSSGSVIPLFKKQILEGGPVTVTDKNVCRYFMTIPESVSLILQAITYAEGGEIFVLDMGKPVRIDDMARNLIRLSGLIPDVDIQIKYIGLRPGEKLYEELLMNEEGLRETKNKLIFIGEPIQMVDHDFADEMKVLATACQENRVDIKKIVAKIVSTYQEQVN